MKSLVARPGAFRWVVAGTLALGTWLLVTAMPVSADGGPHVAAANSGISTLAADGCAGCHRAHTASGEGLLVSADGEQLCLACHGATGTGATTDVESGVQYKLANAGAGQPVAGALRSGGFVDARIDSAHSSRISYPAFMPGLKTTFSSKVGVLATGAPVTSAHLDLDGAGGVVATDTAWGNGDDSATPFAGPVVTMGCTSCHNPHGNGNYRILNDIPSATGVGFVDAPDPVEVLDNAIPVGAGAVGTRNYTIQDGRTLDDVITADLGATAGDYWRRYLPWDLVPGWDGSSPTAVPAGGHAGDVPMYVLNDPDNLESFRSQIRSWCTSCHTRYFANNEAATSPSTDAIYTYKHTNSRVECTQCHVAHGSNAAMTGDFSGPMTYPDGSAPASTTTGGATPTTTYFNSRLLKIDNRGTCQACHDPTGTIPFDGSIITH